MAGEGGSEQAAGVENSAEVLLDGVCGGAVAEEAKGQEERAEKIAETHLEEEK